MALYNDVYCQFCDKLVTKGQWNKHFYSSRPLHREVNGFWPAFFPQRKLTRDEGMILEKVFWEMTFGIEDVLPVYGFLKTYVMMVTNMKDYVTLDPDVDDTGFRYGYSDVMIAQFNNKIYITKITVFKVNVKVMKLILFRTQSNFGLILLMIREVQYLMIFINMIIMMKDWIILFAVQKFFSRLEN